MRAFTTHTTAVALDLDSKWIDNLLTHNQIDGCIRVRQGVGRKLTPRGVLHVAVIAELTRSLRIPVRVACDVARELLTPAAAKQPGSPPDVALLEVSPSLAIRLDLDALGRSITPRLALAVETARRPRRGRPPAGPPTR